MRTISTVVICATESRTTIPEHQGRGRCPCGKAYLVRFDYESGRIVLDSTAAQYVCILTLIFVICAAHTALPPQL